ncbi:MAG: deoxyribodipyrimidine photolyase, partial [Candidatus Sumerlaeia bacterium]|nr:deoxyribodipyrimidine photolyase [Candidatus Sumerlaeia bacterium]
WEKGKDPEPPKFPTFAPDSITREVLETLRTEYADHPGYLDDQAIPATLPQAESYWAFFLQDLLPHFGPYEDAMTIHSTALFHSKVSTLLNLTRLMPERLIRDVEHSQAPLQCREGFIRQILGWREFVRHVHLETDGFRQLPGGVQAVAATPGDGGYERWKGKSWKAGIHIPELDGGSVASYLDAEEPLPPAWWGSRSGLHCLDTVVESVWKEGWSHHITRLMILSNIATLLDISPRELTDWFWVAYSDAWDWVVEPNVMGMGTYGVGPLFTTKPYIAGSAYIDKMSDYCNGCRFKPGNTCPLPQLYWAFLARHQDKLEKNPRLSMPYASLKKRSAAKRQEDERIFESVRSTLQKGESLGTGELF